jgi:superfamily II DNA/RNA helicase
MSEEKSAPTKKYYDYISVGNRTKQVAYFVQQHDKNRMLEELLKPFIEKQILVMVKSKKNADKLHEYFKTKEINSLAIHGNHRASQIEEAEVAFNAKKLNILITTDRIFESMALKNVELLVNYDLPFESTDYFKRLRLVDEIAESLSLIDPEDETMLATIELMMKCDMDEVELESFEHTKQMSKSPKDKTKKPRHKKVAQKAKRKAEIKSKWIPQEEQQDSDKSIQSS